MRTSQEIANALTERLKNAAKNAPPVAPVDRSAEIFPGKRYRDERGRMVIIQRASLLRVTYTREGYRGVSEVGRREFELKFTEVKS
ncbi:TPA: DUF4222 domain-containing protein [Enterobacter ludwigii]|uniref:DUF4222 domain-containing protein n=1 Tax=Enterobacter ludwigii TaxID=299767 RepID=UPI000642E66B|nr:DUF4222 domain-containing protein [Enterobacter ludwigii]KLP36196.1 hypothetical protein ABR36_16660 [Enterobacter ludwigii]HDR2587308.1 DUF4222 domain-containing protein [Enterobacter ludwigii]HDR2600148.1 DUF4222 domain-containing protein [Enterobacter ludwigii]